MPRRPSNFVVFLLISALLVFGFFHSVSWRQLPQVVGMGESVASSTTGGEKTSKKQPWLENGFHEPKVESGSPYAIGQTKPAGSNYTRALVMGRLVEENTAWIEEELSDMIRSGLLLPQVYVVDNRSAALHSPENKGHEVMVYLTYIIDNYENLPDVSIFMHSHRWAWHNNELLGLDSAEMVRRLSPERVTRAGYMNLRCHWDPGCPDWIHPGATEDDHDKWEQSLIADVWAEIFPHEAIPTVLAQPCCAQFAVSRARIEAIPKQQFNALRDWLLRTELSDYYSGRVFEYMWQFVFTSAAVHCPSMSACYCDGYGVCFGGPEKFDKWFEYRYWYDKYSEELRQWTTLADALKEAEANSENGLPDEAAVLEVPEIGKDEFLNNELEWIGVEMDRLRDEAIKRGQNPQYRAEEAGRPWKEGDGF